MDNQTAIIVVLALFALATGLVVWYWNQADNQRMRADKLARMIESNRCEGRTVAKDPIIELKSAYATRCYQKYYKQMKDAEQVKNELESMDGRHNYLARSIEECAKRGLTCFEVSLEGGSAYPRDIEWLKAKGYKVSRIRMDALGGYNHDQVYKVDGLRITWA